MARANPVEARSDELAADVRALRRNVVVNAIGYAFKLGMPVLLAFGTRTYGAAAWGVFVALQALVMIVLRVTILGLDKAMLWWIPSRGREGYGVLSSVIGTVALSSLAVGGGLALVANPVLQAWTGEASIEPDSLRIMALALAPLAAMEVLLHASMGRRRMEATVVVRETVVPATLIAVALLLHAAGFEQTGLAYAFLVSNILGLLGAWLYHRVAFRAEDWTAVSRRAPVPRALFAYAVPLWLAEISNSMLMRVSAVLIAGFTDPVTVGVWGIVTQFGTAMRTIRGAFDSIVTVLAAGISRNHDTSRLSAVLSYAAQLVSLTQFPLFAAIAVFADVVMPLYGPGFERGSVPLIVLCGFWLLNGAAGLAGVVISGYGKSNLTLLNTLVTIAVQTALLIWLVPRHGLVGAAIALGASYSVQHVLQIIQLRVLTGTAGFSRRSALPIVPAVLAAGAAWGVTGAASALANPWAARGAVFATFLAVYGLVSLGLRRRGHLRAPV